MGNLFTQASAYLREHKEYRRWVALFLCLALVISTATTALLTRPGVAMTHTERVLSCPFEGEAAHTHTEDCYQDGVLVCTLPERELHTHTEDCYTTEKTLICEEEESDGHVHTDSCYSLVQGELICTDESEDHVHTDDCYAWESVLSCGLEEGEGAHRHTDACYTETEVLTCGQEELLTEHVHGPGCFTEIVVEDEEPEATETPAPTETPAETETPEATETPAAEEVESDPEADLEYYWMWTEFFSQVTLTGDWNEDLVTVARTQLGYTESARNFTVDEDGRHGYTRYGEWYGLPHGDWCAMFVSFCLNFSDIPREAMPWESVTTRWVKNLTERGMFAMADSDYVPKAGDLVFFTDPEYRERVASHVGIVAEVTDEHIISIEGNNGPTVAEFKYELDDEHIYGYGILPEEPEPEESPAESGLALITAADGTALPEDAQPHAYTLSGPEAEAAQSAVEAWLTAPEGPQMLQTRRASARMAVAERNAAEDEVLSETKYQVFEIGLDNVEASEYEDGFLVRVTLPEALTGRDFTLFHLGDDGVEELTAEYNGIYNDNGTETVTGFSFVTDSFSPFVLRYTVDFHYTAEDGTTYDFSMPGGGFLTLAELVQALHLTQEGEEQAFASAVESVSFSDPSLLWVGRADENTTVGALKASLNLNSAYSADLTASDIAALNETAVSAGDWLLISLHPFDSLETLTITMRDGREISVDVTDARIVAYYLNDRGELYEVGVTYGEDAQIPEGATLKITEYAQDSAEYLKARGEVLAELEKNEVSVDPDSFGLAALDISILDAEGNEIEPAAPVQVDMSIKALPGVENVEAIAETLVVNHHVETETGVVLQTVFVGSTEGVFQFNMPENMDMPEQPVEVNALPGDQAVTMSFETPSFSTYTVSWYNGYRSATIHYGYMDGTTFVEFTPDPTYTTTNTNYFDYLIRDFDGYQYSGYTYYRTSASATPASGGTRIQAMLRYSQNRNEWRYHSYSESYSQDNWTALNNNSHVYVVYDKQPAEPVGGTPKIKQVEGLQPPEPPTITKESTPNGDGTNTLSLSVTGHTVNLEVEKLADVIVVFDISGSMSTTDMSGETRLKAGRDAINALAHTLLNKTNSYGDKLIRMGLITFSTDAQVVQGLTDDETVFTTAVNNQTNADGGTNWEKALLLANQMEVDPERATFVIFVTDGDPTFRVSRMNAQDSELDIYNANNQSYANYYLSNNVFGEGNSDSDGRNYDAAAAVAERITAASAKKNFYTIGISSDVTKLNDFANDVGAKGKFTATDSAQLAQAFDDIASSIIALMGHSDIQISDGITDLTQTVQKSDFVNYTEDDFTYYKGHAATAEDVTAGHASAVGEMVWESWTPSSEGCAEAFYNSETGAVVWNMGDSFMPQDGYTYQVRFKVWPSQEAYDLLADLNNGRKSYGSLSDKEKAQIKEPSTPGGPYTLKTNDVTSYTYREATKSGDTVTPTGEPSEPGVFPDVDPLVLTTKPLKVKKQWLPNYVDSRAPTNEITMELYGVDPDGTTTRTFKVITLSASSSPEPWYDANNFVSYGLVTLEKISNGSESEVKVKIYEKGHDFTLRETGENAHYYDLSAGIYRPMVINGVSTVLQLVDKPAGMSDSAFYYKDGEQEYYRLDGKVYWDTKSDVILIATNSHRSYMDLTKVLDAVNDANPDPIFEFEIKFKVPDGIYNYENMEKYLWFSVYDPVQRKTLTPETEYEYTNAHHPADLPSSAGDFSGPEYADYLIAYSGDTFTLKIKPGWNVRFLNLPIGTTYEFSEVNIPSTYEFRSADVGGTVWDNDLGAAIAIPGPLPSNDGSSPSDTVITGTIELANARYKTTYHNGPYTPRKNISVTKQWSDGDSAHTDDTITFTLYQKAITESGGTVIREEPYTGSYTNTITGSGTVTISDLPSMGTVDGQRVTFQYYVVETGGKPGYIPTVTSSGDNWTILNVAPNAMDEPTSVEFTKKWLGSDGNPAAADAHDGDQIQVKLIQKVVDSGYVPVTVKLIDARNNTQFTDTYYVSKGSIVSLVGSRHSDAGNEHSIYIDGTNQAVNSNQYSRTISTNVQSELSITAQVQYYHSNTAYDTWGTTASEDYVSEWNYRYSRWVYYYYYTWVKPTIEVSNGTILSSIDEVIEAAKSVSGGQTQEYIYTLNKNSLTDGPFTKNMTGDWTGKVSDLPLFRKIDDSTFYAYYYTVEEISVNGEAIRDKVTDASGNMTGQTYDYTVSAVYDQAEGKWIITNRQLRSFSFSKAWIPLNSTIDSVALDALQVWGADRTISVALHRVDPDTSADEVICSYELGGAGTFLPTDSTLIAEQKEAYKLTASNTGKLVTFTISHGLPPENASGHPYTYYVVETDATGGIYNTYYGERNSDAVTWTSGLQKAFDGQVILNHQISTYVLPSTGGIGTLGYQLGGLALIGAALAGLLLRKARRRAKGGDLTA